MNTFHVSCDGARVQKRATRDTQKLALFTSGRECNVSIKISKLQDNYSIPQRLIDFLSIAAFVYSADTRASRGSEYDVLEEKWQRDVHIAVPVLDAAFWSAPDTNASLCEALTFVSGDRFTFYFEPSSRPSPTQIHFDLQDKVGQLSDVNVINMFSGGVDSLGAVIESMNEGLSPLLVSHLTSAKVGSRQSILIEELRKDFPHLRFPHLSIWVTNTQSPRTVEHTQRSRSFLYLALGAVTANVTGVKEIRLCDNGVVSLNLPQSSQTVGTTASRSTHPGFIWRVEDLLRRVAQEPTLTIRNTLLMKTKKEVMSIIRDCGHPELLQETVSCGRTRQSSTAEPHCGVCSQCIDRRFASRALDLEGYDLAEKYGKDIFGDPLKEGNERTYLANYVHFVRQLSDIPNASAFIEKYPDLAACVRPDDANVEMTYRQYWELFQKHQKGITSVLKSLMSEHAESLAMGRVKPDTLVDMIRSSRLDEDFVQDGAGGRRPRCHVLIVVATDVERDTCLKAFELLTGREAALVQGKKRSYHYLGVIEAAGVYLVQSEMGSSSPGASTLTVARAIDELDPTSIILVGIAFGIDSTAHSIGDLIVSKQMQCYDQQRVGKGADGDKEIRLRGDKVTASTRMLQRCRAATVSWKGAKVSFATLLSGEKLIDNVDFRTTLSTLVPEAIGGEMEGTGMYAAAHDASKEWIIIKSICDWADGRKHEHKAEYQSKAAQSAADFVCHVLRGGGFTEV